MSYPLQNASFEELLQGVVRSLLVNKFQFHLWDVFV